MPKEERQTKGRRWDTEGKGREGALSTHTERDKQCWDKSSETPNIANRERVCAAIKCNYRHAISHAHTPTHAQPPHTHTHTLRSVYTYLQWRRMCSAAAAATDNVAICCARQRSPCYCRPLVVRCSRHLLRTGRSSRCRCCLCSRINCKQYVIKNLISKFQ